MEREFSYISKFISLSLFLLVTDMNSKIGTLANQYGGYSIFILILGGIWIAIDLIIIWPQEVEYSTKISPSMLGLFEDVKKIKKELMKNGNKIRKRRRI